MSSMSSFSSYGSSKSSSSVSESSSSSSSAGPAPCTCPGDLASSYSVTFTLAVCPGQSDPGVAGTYTVTVTNGGSGCNWTGSVGVGGLTVSVGLLSGVSGGCPASCFWHVNIGSTNMNPLKITGHTPIGDYGDGYYQSGVCFDGPCPSGTLAQLDISNVSVAA